MRAHEFADRLFTAFREGGMEFHADLALPFEDVHHKRIDHAKGSDDDADETQHVE